MKVFKKRTYVKWFKNRNIEHSSKVILYVHISLKSFLRIYFYPMVSLP
jgi:hypothetical protein